MSNKATWVSFTGIVAFIVATPYFTTAIWVSGVGVSPEVFNQLLCGICVMTFIVGVFVLGGVGYFTSSGQKGLMCKSFMVYVTSSDKNNPCFNN